MSARDRGLPVLDRTDRDGRRLEAEGAPRQAIQVAAKKQAAAWRAVRQIREQNDLRRYAR